LITARYNDLEPWVVGYDSSELDIVALALSDLFGSFPSMRQKDEDVAGRIDSLRRLLEASPAWAILRVSDRIRRHGYVAGDGKTERHWPPSDAEIVDMVRTSTRIYSDSFDSAAALLIAQVEA
jgi:hypothetical protein